MQNMAKKQAKRSERGAIQIKTILVLLVVAIGAFLVIKIAPVYINQRQLTHDVDELARLAAVRNTDKDKLARQIDELRTKYDLKEGSISLVSKEQGRVQIAVNYTVPIDLLVTTYDWKYEYTSLGKEF